MEIELVTKGARAVILPEFGGRLHQLHVEVDGREEPLLVTPPEIRDYSRAPLFGGSYPMAPWPNRVREGRFRFDGVDHVLPLNDGESALHGLVFDRPWRIIARTSRVCELIVELDDRWPWPGCVWQRYEISPGRLRMKMEVRAERFSFPAGCGWHPWFRSELGATRPLRVSVPASRRYVMEERIPTGEMMEPSGQHDLRTAILVHSGTLDHCYATLTGPIQLEWGRGMMTVSVECAAPHVMVYTSPGAVCIEPQTCPPDAFNLASRMPGSFIEEMATPGKPVSLASSWTWSTGGHGS